MPMFEYQCNNCQKEFTKLFFRGDKEEAQCPKCKSFDNTKIMSATSFMGSSIGTSAAGSPKQFS